MSPEQVEQLEVLAAILARDGVKAGLGFLNARVPHRYTALYKMKGQAFHKVCLVDKRGGEGMDYLEVVPEHISMAATAIHAGEFVMNNTLTHQAAIPHRIGVVASCVIMRVDDLNGEAWGTVAHFDMVERQVSCPELELFRQVPQMLQKYLGAWSAT